MWPWHHQRATLHFSLQNGHWMSFCSPGASVHSAGPLCTGPQRLPHGAVISATGHVYFARLSHSASPTLFRPGLGCSSSHEIGLGLPLATPRLKPGPPLKGSSSSPVAPSAPAGDGGLWVPHILRGPMSPQRWTCTETSRARRAHLRLSRVCSCHFQILSSVSTQGSPLRPRPLGPPSCQQCFEACGNAKACRQSCLPTAP